MINKHEILANIYIQYNLKHCPMSTTKPTTVSSYMKKICCTCCGASSASISLKSSAANTH